MSTVFAGEPQCLFDFLFSFVLLFAKTLVDLDCPELVMNVGEYSIVVQQTIFVIHYRPHVLTGICFSAPDHQSTRGEWLIEGGRSPSQNNASSSSEHQRIESFFHGEFSKSPSYSQPGEPEGEEQGRGGFGDRRYLDVVHVHAPQGLPPRSYLGEDIGSGHG